MTLSAFFGYLALVLVGINFVALFYYICAVITYAIYTGILNLQIEKEQEKNNEIRKRLENYGKDLPAFCPMCRKKILRNK